MEFVDDLLTKNKFNKEDREQYIEYLSNKVKADKHELGSIERLEVVQNCFNKNINSVISNIHDFDEMYYFKKCVRKGVKCRIHMMAYYQQLMKTGIQSSCVMHWNSLRDDE
ncbi:unnamed protein product [Moneuplotes crassus]|uniref:Uncharacterized protein n=1 Tax=Euplotes crassus TaxID=5936 RepID=A0AAD1Y6M7_EUPCR|nr:unnamed protein product [Moneuplotes crassus]